MLIFPGRVSILSGSILEEDASLQVRLDHIFCLAQRLSVCTRNYFCDILIFIVIGDLSLRPQIPTAMAAPHSSPTPTAYSKGSSKSIVGAKQYTRDIL